MEGFEIQVPITLKGGNEGDKVGTQIGKKIADQINRLNKSVGVGQSKSSGTGVSSLLTSGIGKIALGIGALVVVTKGIFKQLKASSPFLEGTFRTLKDAWNLMWKPFGDFVATAIWPLSKAMMQMSIKWNQFALTDKGKEVVSKISTAPGKILKATATGGASAVTDIGAWVTKKIQEIDFSKLKDIPGWLWTQITNIWSWTKDVGSWLWGKITGVWNWANDVGGWLWDRITSIWSWGKDVAGWLWGKITSIWTWSKNLATWVWDKITGVFDGLTSKFRNFSSWLWDTITGLFTKNNSKQDGSYSSGKSFIANDGIYKLHRGEQVVSRTNTNKSTVYNPTFQIEVTGSNSGDYEDWAKKASSMITMDLKQRGII